MTVPTFKTHREADEAGWYSRRHETHEARDVARAKYQHERGPKARKRRAAERLLSESVTP